MTLPARYSDGSTTIGQVLTDANIRAVFGAGDNLIARIYGVQVDRNTIFGAGSEIVLETACNTKAA